MVNVLKKLTAGNPLIHFKLWEELDEYDTVKTDEELCDFYHKMLNKFENRPLVSTFIMAMISYSIEINLSQIPTEI
jgi:hypothetical protein